MKHVLLGSFLAALLVLPMAAQDPSAGNRFAIAIEKGDVEAVEGLLAAGNKADTWIEYGENKVTPLMKACWDGREKIVEVLIAPFSSSSIVAMLAGWHMPASSPFTMSSLSVAAYPKRSASVRLSALWTVAIIIRSSRKAMSDFTDAVCPGSMPGA